MSRILITGMSGAGKSSLLAELARRGYETVDTDYESWKKSDGLWDDGAISGLLAAHPDVIVSGTVENQARYYDRFEHVLLLSAPIEILIERVTSRTNSSYGRSAEQQAEIRRYVVDVEPLLRQGATAELDGRRTIEELADVVQGLM
jgi:dephospho-CoA kinase